MNEQSISFEVAKLAKTKGIGNLGNYMIDITGKISDEHQSVSWNNLDLDHVVYLPTQSLLQKWLRDIHGIYIELNFDCIVYDVHILHEGKEKISLLSTLNGGTPYCFTTYENALDNGLFHALQLIITK